MGRNHARVLAGLKEVELVALFDPLAEDGLCVQGVPVTRDFDAFVSGGLDYVVVASPTSTHLEYGVKLAELKIAALVEKPLASTYAEGQLLAKAFHDAGVLCVVGHVERFNPALQALKVKLKEGLIGEIIQITTRRTGPFPGRISDVGVVKDLASHDIDLTTWIAASRYKDLEGRTFHRSGRPHEDGLLAIGSLESGVVVSHTVNWLSPFKERQTTVLGDKGLLIADTLLVDLVFASNGNVSSDWDSQTQFRGVSEGDIIKFALERVEPLVAEHRSLISALHSGDFSSIVSIADGLEVLRVAELLEGKN